MKVKLNHSQFLILFPLTNHHSNTSELLNKGHKQHDEIMITIKYLHIYPDGCGFTTTERVNNLAPD